MTFIKRFSVAIVLASMAMAPFAGSTAEEKKADAKSGKIKPYTLKVCPVSDEKLGEMGDPYVFTQGDREIKLCCKSCQKDFKKDPAKFIKKIEEAEKKAGKSKS
jgi:hypothetical protein